MAEAATRPSRLSLYVTSRLPVLGQKDDVLLIDPSQYVFGVPQALTADRSQHALVGSDQLAIRARVRGDGQPP
jgi:hypothetical protein